MRQLEFMLSHIYDVYIRYVTTPRKITYCRKPYVAYEYTTYEKATYAYATRAGTAHMATYGMCTIYVYRKFSEYTI